VLDPRKQYPATDHGVLEVLAAVPFVPPTDPPEGGSLPCLPRALIQTEEDPEVQMTAH
jgi:hypothetical protein